MLLAEARYNVALYIFFGGFPLSTTIHAYVVPVETGPEDGTEDDTGRPVTYNKVTCVLKLYCFRAGIWMWRTFKVLLDHAKFFMCI